MRLGGEMGINTDATGIQFRMLNASKGPSVRGPRAQCDKKAYQFRLKATCERQERLDVKQGHIAEILVEGDRVTGVSTQLGVTYQARCVVVTTGTFLQGLMHVGLRQTAGGRMGDSASGLSASLLKLGFELQRLKTGTPPRLLKRSLDFSKLELQHGDQPPLPFSYLASELRRERNDIFTLNEWRNGMFHVEQLPCAITYTTAATHQIVRDNLDKSPLYCGRIEGIGPRYCPSLEDKVVRFADKERHQLFLEPEGRHTDEYYINGCSTSLPFEVQVAFIRSIPGLEHAEIMRAGYAVEYDFAPPTQLQPSLETKRVGGLFFAGQLNGTSGYEEAAGQGAHRRHQRGPSDAGSAARYFAARPGLYRRANRRPRDAGNGGAVSHVHLARGASVVPAARQCGPAADANRRGGGIGESFAIGSVAI